MDMSLALSLTAKSGLKFVAPPGPLASAPVASAANLGLCYLETGDPLWPNGRVYQSRYNGNYVNSAVTSAKDRVQPTLNFNADTNFDFEIKFRQDSADSVGFTGLFCQGTSVTTTRGFWIERDGTSANYVIKFYNSTGQVKQASVLGIINGAWNVLDIIRAQNNVFIYKNHLLASTIDMTGFVVNTVTESTIGSQQVGVRAINGNIAKCSVKCSTGCFTYEFNQATGTKILDTSGNGNNGTLTDALPTDFWKIGWTPLQW